MMKEGGKERKKTKTKKKKKKREKDATPPPIANGAKPASEPTHQSRYFELQEAAVGTLAG